MWFKEEESIFFNTVFSFQRGIKKNIIMPNCKIQSRLVYNYNY